MSVNELYHQVSCLPYVGKLLSNFQALPFIFNPASLGSILLLLLIIRPWLSRNGAMFTLACETTYRSKTRVRQNSFSSSNMFLVYLYYSNMCCKYEFTENEQWIWERLSNFVKVASVIQHHKNNKSTYIYLTPRLHTPESPKNKTLLLKVVRGGHAGLACYLDLPPVTVNLLNQL